MGLKPPYWYMDAQNGTVGLVGGIGLLCTRVHIGDDVGTLPNVKNKSGCKNHGDLISLLHAMY